MKEKIYEPARHNETSPAPGMAAVNTHMSEEEPIEELINEQHREEKGQAPAGKTTPTEPGDERQ